jgi:hypothetical protein
MRPSVAGAPTMPSRTAFLLSANTSVVVAGAFADIGWPLPTSAAMVTAGRCSAARSSGPSSPRWEAGVVACSSCAM